MKGLRLQHAFVCVLVPVFCGLAPHSFKESRRVFFPLFWDPSCKRVGRGGFHPLRLQKTGALALDGKLLFGWAFALA